MHSFADEVYGLFRDRQSPHRAWCLRARLLGDPAYQAFPGLVAAMAMLERAKFAKMIAFLKSPARQRVRTNNHVERANRKLRYFEKVRYKWRRRRTLVRFLVLAMDRWWGEVRARDLDSQAEPATGVRSPTACPSHQRSPRRRKPSG